MKRVPALILLAMIGAASCASSGRIQPGNPVVGAEAKTQEPKRRQTRIVVYKVGNECKASIDDLKITGKPKRPIAWMVEDDGDGIECKGTKKWYIKLVFPDGPWNGPDGHKTDDQIDIKRNGTTQVDVDKDTKYTPDGMGHKYKVYLAIPKFGDDDLFPLIDPEVEIER